MNRRLIVAFLLMLPLGLIFFLPNRGNAHSVHGKTGSGVEALYAKMTYDDGCGEQETW